MCFVLQWRFVLVTDHLSSFFISVFNGTCIRVLILFLFFYYISAFLIIIIICISKYFRYLFYTPVNGAAVPGIDGV